jgi:hypothetical protein
MLGSRSRAGSSSYSSARARRGNAQPSHDFGALTFAVVPLPVLASGPVNQSPDCVPCPDGGCYPQCGGGGGGGGGGGCSAPTLSNVVVTPHATNVTVSWSINPTGSSSYFDWGNTTSYGYSDNVGTNTALFVDYLNSATTYYFEIQSFEQNCGNAAVWQGSFTTSSDSMTTFSGIVTDPNNGLPPTNTFLLAYCVLFPPQVSGSGYTAAETSSTGHYSMPAPQWYNNKILQWEPCSAGGGGYLVTVFSSPTTLLGSNVNNPAWPGHWNETIVTWAPQVVNFYINLAKPSSNSIAEAMEFTHTNAAQVSFCKDSSSSLEFETTNSQSGTLYGLSYSVTSTSSYSTQFGSSSCVDGQGSPGFEAWGSPNVAGMEVFNAIESRTISAPYAQYYGPLSNGGSGNANGGPIQDWASEPTSESEACVNTYGIYMFHYHIPANSATQTFNFYAGGTVSGVSEESFGVSQPIELDGTPIGTLSGSWGYSLTTTLSQQFYASVVVPGPVSTDQYFTVACTPGSTSETGIVLHVWQDSGPP